MRRSGRCMRDSLLAGWDTQTHVTPDRRFDRQCGADFASCTRCTGALRLGQGEMWGRWNEPRLMPAPWNWVGTEDQGAKSEPVSVDGST
ncbi:MAG: hypothetical protein ACI91O_001516 [Candidatus Poriferisodalaceae bacterium]|jgi:hypothetical protein